MRILYRRHQLHNDQTEAQKVILAGFQGWSRPELAGIPQFKNAQIKVQMPPESTVQSEFGENTTVALARTDLILTEEQGNLKFRHLLFVVFCLATFRDKSEIPALFSNAFPGRQITPHTVTVAEKWMRRLDADPDLALKGKDKRWKELWLQFCDQRREYLGTIKDIPLAHPRKRIEALVDILQDCREAVPDKILEVPGEFVRDDNGNIVVSRRGTPIREMKTIIVHKKAHSDALQCLKQIGVESGTYVEKTETKLTFRDLIKRRRQERGFRDQIQDAQIVDQTFEDADAEMPEVELRLPCPVTVTQEMD